MSLNEKERMERYLEQEKRLAERTLANSKDAIENFKKLATSKGIILNADSFSYIHKIGVVASYPNLAERLLGDIQKERDGLFSFDEIVQKISSETAQEGYFLCSNYTIMADSCFRRQMHSMNNWAPRFIALFWQLDSPNIKKYISIEKDRVRICHSSIMEFDTWYGAPFNGDISKIQSGITKLKPSVGITKELINALFEQVYCLDIQWSERKQIKTFQALEIKNENVQMMINGQVFYPARYLHAEFDLSKNEFRHFDGAIQFFTEEEYLERRDADFNMVFKNTNHVKAHSKKVFKLNGSISVDQWSEFCSQFFVKNPLIFEYFTGSYPPNIIERLNGIRSKN